MKHPATAIVLLLAAVLGSSATPPSAMAGAAPQTAPSTSSIAQYVEEVPSAGGSVPLGRGSGTVAHLAPGAQKALAQSGGSDASTLQKIAVDPALGAPTQTGVRHVPTNTSAGHASVPRGTGTKTTPKARATPRPSLPSTEALGSAPPTRIPNALSAAESTVGVSNLGILLIVLVALTAGGVLLARRQRWQ